MELKNFNPKDIIFSLDIGTRSIIGTVGIIKNKKFEVICEEYLEHEERAMVDGQIHDVGLVASVVEKVKSQIEQELDLKLTDVSIAAAGRFLRTIDVDTDIDINDEEEIDKELVRSLELSGVRKAQEKINETSEGKLYCVGYSVKNFFLNGFLISNLIGQKGEKVGAQIIATFLPRSVVDSLYSVMNKVNLKVTNLTLEPIAAMEAAVPKNLRLLNIALVDIGAGTSDIAISSNQSISAYGMVPMAGDEITETIVQEYLVDFNTAERIKKSIEREEEIEYVDVLGMENTVSCESVRKVIESIVKKEAEEISKKILELNGQKAPSAVFLVGGGAHTPGILEEIANRLDLPSKRIAVKDRQAVTECCCDNGLGSAGVTVLGIALIAIKSLGHDFIDVVLNNESISLFNSHKHNVMDVLLQAGINAALLISKNGKSLRFTYNGSKRIVFGDYGTNAKFLINGEEANIETEIRDKDNIELIYAVNGKDAAPLLSEYINNIDSISIYINNELINIEPIILVNGEKQNIDYVIKNGDDINVFLPNTVEQIKKYVIKEDVELLQNDIILDDEYIVREGENISKEYIEKLDKESSKELEVTCNEAIKESTLDTEETDIVNDEDNKLQDEAVKSSEITTIDSNSIELTVNNEKITLVGKQSYVIVDIFNYIDFDLTVPKGAINIILNGEKSSYTENIKNGDNIEVFWSK